MFTQYIANVSKFADGNTFSNRWSLITGYSIAFHSDAVQCKFHMQLMDSYIRHTHNTEKPLNFTITDKGV
jgi:hypothetical protein